MFLLNKVDQSDYPLNFVSNNQFRQRAMKKYSILLIIFTLLWQVCFPAEKYVWKNVTIGGGGYVTGIIACATQKNLFYAKTDVGGAYRWNEEQQSWISLTDWVSKGEMGYLGVESIAIDPQHPNKLYISAGLEYYPATKPAIFYSDDYGNTFNKTLVPFMIHGNGYGRGVGERLIVDPNDSTILFCGTRKDGLWKSSDMARTWTKVSSFPVSETENGNGICAVVIDPASGLKGSASKTIFVGVSKMGASNLFVSNDAGETWKPVEGQITNFAPQRMVITPNNYLIVTYGDGAGPHASKTELLISGNLLKYNIQDKKWFEITPSRATKAALSGVSFQQDSSHILMVTSTNAWWVQDWVSSKTVKGDEIYRSTDGGITWTSLFAKKKTKLEVGEFEWGNPTSNSDPVSLHWATCITIDPFNGNRAFVNSGNGIFMCDNLNDSITNWKFQVKGLEETVPLGIVSPAGGASLLSVVGDYDGFRHDVLTKSPTKGRYKPQIGTTRTIDFAENDPHIVVRAGSSAFVSRDNAKTWESLIPPFPEAKDGSLAISPDGKTVVWCPDNSPIYTTSNYRNWALAVGSIKGQRVISDRVNSSKFYFFNNKALYFSNNKGATFSKGSTDPALTNVRKIRCSPGIEGDIWIPSADNGLYRTTWINNLPAFTKIDKVTNCEAVGFGKAKTGKKFPAIYIWGVVDSIEGIFRSDDEGKSWVRINDDAHEFGGTGDANEIIGDPRIYGRVYMSTAGRGIVYGDLVGGKDSKVVLDPEDYSKVKKTK